LDDVFAAFAAERLASATSSPTLCTLFTTRTTSWIACAVSSAIWSIALDAEAVRGTPHEGHSSASSGIMAPHSEHFIGFTLGFWP
jgi:hypothetical protein